MSDAPTADASTETGTEVEEAPRDEVREALVADLADHLGDALVAHHIVPGHEAWIRVATDSWRHTAEVLRARGFHFFSFLSAIDWMPSPYGRGEDNPDDEPAEPDTTIRQGYTGGDTRFQVFARVVDVVRHLGITVKADVPDDTMTVDSWIEVYTGANWHEREANEMFGITFTGHPDLRNMYLPGDFEGHPLRKDFPLLARMIKPWPGIVDVEPLPPEPEEGEEAEASAGSADGESAGGGEPAAGEAVEGGNGS